jgi:quercetin dioxygenase-like cupin family protein
VSAFGKVEAMHPLPIWDGLAARAVHGERITLAVVEVEPAALLPEHSHDNEQLGIVIQGSLTLRVDGEERTLGPGETWRIASNTPHSGVAGAEGAVVVDVFAPPRRDWGELSPGEPQRARWP